MSDEAPATEQEVGQPEEYPTRECRCPDNYAEEEKPAEEQVAAPVLAFKF